MCHIFRVDHSALSTKECRVLALYERDFYVLKKVKSTTVCHQSYFISFTPATYTVLLKNNVKVCCSCMPNKGSIIKNHNKKILNNNNTRPQNGCNCRQKDQCRLNNNCLITSIIYKANVITDKDNTGKNYIGLTEGTFNNDI